MTCRLPQYFSLGFTITNLEGKLFGACPNSGLGSWAVQILWQDQAFGSQILALSPGEKKNKLKKKSNLKSTLLWVKQMNVWSTEIPA